MYFFLYLLPLTFLAVPRKHIMCEDRKEATLECSDYGTVLEIHKAYVGQDVKELLKCVSDDVSPFQSPCTQYPDRTIWTKIKCDGRLSCNISDLPNVDVCPSHAKSFIVEFVCQIKKTEGKFSIDL